MLKMIFELEMFLLTLFRRFLDTPRASTTQIILKCQKEAHSRVKIDFPVSQADEVSSQLNT